MLTNKSSPTLNVPSTFIIRLKAEKFDKLTCFEYDEVCRESVDVVVKTNEYAKQLAEEAKQRVIEVIS
jgi:hypothetical protein